jgi:hypothetical protein
MKSKPTKKMDHQTGGTIGGSPQNLTATQLDHRFKGKPAQNTTSPRGIEESGKAILSRGSRGDEVAQLQTYLKSNGYYTGSVDGIFGPKTAAAVKAFQSKSNNQDMSDNRVSYVQDGQTREIGYNTGGDIGAVIGAAAPLLSLIPGAQPFAPIAAGVGSLLQMSAQ